jgi:hypothetical protein
MISSFCEKYKLSLDLKVNFLFIILKINFKLIRKLVLDINYYKVMRN